MSEGLVPPFGEEASMLRQLLPRPQPPAVVTESETASGALTMREASVPDASWPQDRQLEIVEMAEAAELAVAPRFYEELEIRKEARTRVETVRAVLRREDAEVTTEAGPGEARSGEAGPGMGKGPGVRAGLGKDGRPG